MKSHSKLILILSLLLVTALSVYALLCIGTGNIPELILAAGACIGAVCIPKGKR